jgi:two-component system NtrC family sensor kinase
MQSEGQPKGDLTPGAPRGAPGAAASGHETAQSAEQLVGSVIDASLDAVIIAGLDGRILRINPAAEQLFGPINGKTIGESIVPAAFRVAHERGFAHHVATGERKVIGQRLELEALNAEGQAIPIEIQIEEILQGDRRVFAAFIRDLTERKAMEAQAERQRETIHQQEKLAALATLLAGVAHELNNPLAVVLGRASLLEDKLAGTAEERSIHKLREAADRCHRIVKTFLAMAREGTPRRERVALNRLLEGALDFTAYGLRHSQIRVMTQFDAALPDIQGDHDQLVQAFVGILINAQQALESVAGERCLTVSTERAGTQVRVTIADNGPGMGAELRARVFEPFFTTREFGAGGGMGLAIARGVFEAHGGKIALGDGPGCTILVTLPAA